MGKRSEFARHIRDYYRTPISAVTPLIPHLGVLTFDEPCCGDGTLVRHLQASGLHCLCASDIEPQGYGQSVDALTLTHCSGGQYITNPPWARDILHPLILHLSDLAPTWMLFDADWAHTRQAVPFLKRCSKIVSVGRVRWIEGTKTSGKDNCAWYLFEREAAEIAFFGRAA